MSKKRKKNLVLRNIKFITPLLFKHSPLTIPLMVVSAIIDSIRTLFATILPSMILQELLGSREIRTIVIYILLLSLGQFILQLISIILDGLLNYSTSKADFEIEKIFNDKIMSIDYFNIEDPAFIDKMNRAKKGMDEYSNGIYSFVYSLREVIEAVITIAGVIGIVVYSKQYIAMILTLIAIITNTIIYRKIQNINQEFRNSMVRYERKLNYYNRNIISFRMQKDLRLFGGKELLQTTTDDTNPPAIKAYTKLSQKLSLLGTIDSFCYYVLTQFLSILYLGYQCVNKVINISTFQLLFTSLKTLDGQIANLIYNVQDYIKACEYQDEFIDIIEMESAFVNGVKKIDKIESIEFKNVSFKYPRTDNYILKDVSFKITNKEKVSLVGLNGAGKTTIIKLICRFYEIEEGEILVNGININELDYKEYMKQIAVVFQDFMIVSFSIRSNIAITERNQEKLYDVLKRAQVLDRVLELENKENTYINKWFDKTGIAFSGGEMQKFAIARCLYKDSDFVVLDEPTSALDPVAEAKIYYEFNDIVGKKLTLFISHRLSSCIFSDHIMVLDGNKIVEEGTHKELMKNEKGLYYKMFTSQAAYYQD